MMWMLLKRMLFIAAVVFIAILGLIWVTDDNPHKRRRH